MNTKHKLATGSSRLAKKKRMNTRKPIKETTTTKITIKEKNAHI
jgi:hypothetical protein